MNSDANQTGRPGCSEQTGNGGVPMSHWFPSPGPVTLQCPCCRGRTQRERMNHCGGSAGQCLHTVGTPWYRAEVQSRACKNASPAAGLPLPYPAFRHLLYELLTWKNVEVPRRNLSPPPPASSFLHGNSRLERGAAAVPWRWPVCPQLSSLHRSLLLQGLPTSPSWALCLAPADISV